MGYRLKHQTDHESMTLAHFFSKRLFKKRTHSTFFLLLFVLLVGIGGKSHAAISQHTIESGQWHQLVVPGDSGSLNIANLFPDTLPSEQYNTSWVVYRWDHVTGEYVNPGLDGRLATGEGFWFIHLTGNSVILDAADFGEAQTATSSACPSAAGCTDVTAFTDTSTSLYSMLGSAQSTTLSVNSLQFVAPSTQGDCAGGCNQRAAADAGFMEFPIYHYNSDTGTYEDLNDVGVLNAWESAWFQRTTTLSGAAANYLFPVADTSINGFDFTDLTAAPNGAPVSLFGVNVNGPLIVGGVTMTNCPFINETVYQVPETGTRLAKTTCWLEGLAQGNTTIKAGGSSELPFIVNNGSVSTITSFAEFNSAMADPVPGDVFLLKGFTTDLAVDGKTNGGKHTLWMRDGEHNGTEQMPIALIGYPDDPAKLVVSSITANANRSISLQNNWWTVSNLDFETVWNAIGARGQSRIVGNRVNGMTGPKAGSGTGTITGGGQSKGGHILGNTIFGGASNWRFDHAIYLSNCPDEQGWVVGWNYIYDNDFARGPQIIINHQPPRCGSGLENKSLASHFVQYNTVDTSRYRGRCIGINSFGWDHESNPNQPDWSYIENNDLLDCGFVGSERDSFGDARQGAALFVSRGGAFVRNNRFVRAQEGIQIGHAGTSVVNNLLGAVVDNNQIDLESGDAIFVRGVIADRVTVGDNPIGPIQF